MSTITDEKYWALQKCKIKIPKPPVMYKHKGYYGVLINVDPPNEKIINGVHAIRTDLNSAQNDIHNLLYLLHKEVCIKTDCCLHDRNTKISTEKFIVHLKDEQENLEIFVGVTENIIYIEHNNDFEQKMFVFHACTQNLATESFNVKSFPLIITDYRNYQYAEGLIIYALYRKWKSTISDQTVTLQSINLMKQEMAKALFNGTGILSIPQISMRSINNIKNV